ncbi:MAG: PAS domain-containing protein [Cyclobacteriaceae bacterium]|nr:PAS domain-containing protein [Cyclobacteriaceae bacterium]
MFSKFKNSIVGKIMTGYVAIICLAFVTTLISMYAAWQNKKIDQRVSEAYYPMVLSLKELEMLASESYKLTNNWVYQPNVKEKEKLKTIHSVEAVEQRVKFLTITGKLENTTAVEEARTIMNGINQLLNEEVPVMEKLAIDEAYSDDVVIDEVITQLDKKITPTYKNVIHLITQATEMQNQLLQEAKEAKASYSNLLTYLYLGNIIFFLVIGIYATKFSVKSITKPIADLSNLITMVSKGKFVEVTLKKGKDEIGRMAEAIQNMLTGLKSKVEFAENIGKGNYSSKFELLSEDDTMGEALIRMRDNLNKAAEEDHMRSWATEGLAKFADILRSRNNNISELSDSITSNLVKYMNASQGALFLINDDNNEDSFIELVACFAYDRKKYLHKRIELGEGITGQCVLEKDTIYLSDIPENYMNITSGLGEALPRNLLIVPLKLDEMIFGVVEIASFNTILPHQIEFVEKLGESIASTISSVKVNSRTKKLLEETQVQAEQMRAQEEEMRQNMEELSATQEEMQRVLQIAQSKEEYLNEVLNSSKDSIYTIDRSFKLMSFNKAFENLMKDKGFHAEKGLDMLNTVEGKKREKLRSNYHRATQGNHFEEVEAITLNDREVHAVNTYSPLRNEKNEIQAIVCFSKNITEMVQARHAAEKMATDAKQTTEEMKAQEEELRQNMEELAATQEEMQRVLSESQGREEVLKNLINISNDDIFSINQEFKLLDFNRSFERNLKGKGIKVARGFNMLSLFSDEEGKKRKSDYQRVFAGESIECVETIVINGEEIYYTRNYSPLKNKAGEIVAIACYTKNSNSMVTNGKAKSALAGR